MQQLTNTKQRDAVAIRAGLRQSGHVSADLLVFGTTIGLICVCIALALHTGTVLALLSP